MRVDRISQPSKQISFTYKSVLKDEWKSNPEMQEHVKIGLYGGKLDKKNLSFEHIKPASKGGSTCLSNGALTTKEMNNLRGNSPLTDFLTKEMFESYVEEFKGWSAKLFNNEEYIKGITKAVIKEGLDLKI